MARDQDLLQEARVGDDAAKSSSDDTVEELMLEAEEKRAQDTLGMDSIDPEELSEAVTSKEMCIGGVSATDDAR